MATLCVYTVVSSQAELNTLCNIQPFSSEVLLPQFEYIIVLNGISLLSETFKPSWFSSARIFSCRAERITLFECIYTLAQNTVSDYILRIDPGDVLESIAHLISLIHQDSSLDTIYFPLYMENTPYISRPLDLSNYISNAPFSKGAYNEFHGAGCAYPKSLALRYFDATSAAQDGHYLSLLAQRLHFNLSFSTSATYHYNRKPNSLSSCVDRLIEARINHTEHFLHRFGCDLPNFIPVYIWVPKHHPRREKLALCWNQIYSRLNYSEYSLKMVYVTNSDLFIENNKMLDVVKCEPESLSVSLHSPTVFSIVNKAASEIAPNVPSLYLNPQFLLSSPLSMRLCALTLIARNTSCAFALDSETSISGPPSYQSPILNNQRAVDQYSGGRRSGYIAWMPNDSTSDRLDFVHYPVSISLANLEESTSFRNVESIDKILSMYSLIS